MLTDCLIRCEQGKALLAWQCESIAPWYRRRLDDYQIPCRQPSRFSAAVRQTLHLYPVRSSGGCLPSLARGHSVRMLFGRGTHDSSQREAARAPSRWTGRHLRRPRSDAADLPRARCPNPIPDEGRPIDSSPHVTPSAHTRNCLAPGLVGIDRRRHAQDSPNATTASQDDHAGRSPSDRHLGEMTSALAPHTPQWADALPLPSAADAGVTRFTLPGRRHSGPGSATGMGRLCWTFALAQDRRAGRRRSHVRPRRPRACATSLLQKSDFTHGRRDP